jgi:hypothetical protein|uniref:hypothetical protein n=1 Tax=Cephaloticoccus sp. TaxID=1985742 RepID=UPI00404A6375
MTSSNVLLQDVIGDQQTGQGQDEFAGDATYAGFQQKAGLLGGADTIMFRAHMQKYDSKGLWGELGNGYGSQW